MPNPNAHDQPAEGGSEQVERALQKQSEPKQKKKKDVNSDSTRPSGKDRPRERDR